MTVQREIVGRVLHTLPPGVIRRASGRYLAGATVQDAMRCVRALAAQGCGATIAVLGEAAATPAGVEAAVGETHGVLDEISRLDPGHDIRLGVKLTALGLQFDAGLAQSELIALAEHAAGCGVVIEVDMEKSTYVDQTLSAVRGARTRFPEVRAVIQAELYRSISDAESLVAEGIPTRIVKGAYKEGPGVAYKSPEVIRANYLGLVGRYLETGVPVGVATHDEYLIYRVREMAVETGGAPARFEFQMIMGIQESLRSALVDWGLPVRVTVSFGADSHLWAIRRLQENPEVVRHAFVAMANGRPGRRRSG
jgi:proline dehydrogenase